MYHIGYLKIEDNKITNKMLKGACLSSRRRFKRLFPNGTVVTKKIVREALLRHDPYGNNDYLTTSDLYWFVYTKMSAEACNAWDKAKADHYYANEEWVESYIAGFMAAWRKEKQVNAREAKKESKKVKNAKKGR